MPLPYDILFRSLILIPHFKHALIVATDVFYNLITILVLLIVAILLLIGTFPSTALSGLVILFSYTFLE